jgi:hypothetical protein
MRKGEVLVGSQDMKKIILSSLIALSIVGTDFAQTATPTPPATTQEDITRLEAK